MARDDGVGLAVPPGWYRDPTRSGGLRWWDGCAWTNDVSAAPPRPSWRDNSDAWIGLWLALTGPVTMFGLGALLGPVAVVLGVKGLHNVNRAPQVRGRGAAIAAIVLGVVNIIFGLAWVAVFSADPNFTI